MNKRTLLKIMYSIALIYLGLLVLIFPYFFHSYFLYDSKISDGLGMFFIFLGSFQLFYNKLSKKIDTISDNITNLKEAGIEQIIPAGTNGYEQLERIIYNSENIKITINTYRLTDKFFYFLNSLLENDLVRFQIIFTGALDEPKIRFFIKTLHKKNRENIKIKVLENTQIDNLLVFNKKSCVMHYSDFDNKLSFFILFHAASEDNYKNEELFNSLWNEGKLYLNVGEGE